MAVTLNGIKGALRMAIEDNPPDDENDLSKQEIEDIKERFDELCKRTLSKDAREDSEDEEE